MLIVLSNHHDIDVLLWFKLSCKPPSISDCNTISDDAANSCYCCFANGHRYTANNSYRFNDSAFTKWKGKWMFLLHTRAMNEWLQKIVGNIRTVLNRCDYCYAWKKNNWWENVCSAKRFAFVLWKIKCSCPKPNRRTHIKCYHLQLVQLLLNHYARWSMM